MYNRYMNQKVNQIAILSDYSNFKMPSNTKHLTHGKLGKRVLWKNDDVVDLLKNNFDPDVLKAYNMIKPNALKADLARYCILYTYGGWYLDLLMTVDGGVPHGMHDYEILVFRDIPGLDKVSFLISNSIIWVKEPGHKIFKDVIDDSVKNILNKIYPKTSHRVTGPFVFGKNVAKYCIENENAHVMVGDLSFNNDNGYAEFTTVDWQNKKNTHFAWHRMPGLENELPENYQKGSSYDEMFRRSDIYEQ